MNHPFDLDPAELEAMDLDFEETLTEEEAAHIGGGISYTTLAWGEEGGGSVQCISAPCPGSEGGGGVSFPRPPVFDPPASTDAIGEEGGGWTQAWFENGGGPIYW
jgi:hypothetical protein